MTKISELPLATSVGQYDLVPVVQNGVTKGARAGMFGSGTTSTSSTTTTSSSSGTVIRPESYGAKSDGIILTDLIVSQGSTTISSNVGPFQSTAIDGGKIVYWRTGVAGWGSGIIATVTNSKQAVLTAPASSGSAVDGGPNSCAAFGTDCTSAFNQAYAAAQAPWIAAGFDRRYITPSREVRLSAGVYLVKPLTTMTAANVVTSGEGMYNTIVACVEPGTIYNLNDFNANISYAYGGEVLNWVFRNMRFVNPVLIQGSSTGSKYNNAIQDNGNGGVTVENVSFTGFKYGYAATSGGDFTRMSGCYFNLCDVGTYFGPGAQQLEINNCDWSQCREGLVTEGVQNWHAGGNCHWQDPIISGITIEGKSSGKTRFGIAPDVGGGAWYAGSMIVDGSPWFESNSGNNGGTAPRLIWINGDGPYGVGVDGFVLRDAHVISGGNQVSGGTNSLVELNTNYVNDRPVLLENVDIGGSYINYLINCTGNASNPRPTIRDCSYDESKIQMVRNTNAHRYVKRNGNYHGFTAV